LRRLAYISSCQKIWPQAARYATQAQALLEQSNKLISPLVQNATFYAAAKYRAQNGQQDGILALVDQAHATLAGSTDDEPLWWADDNTSSPIKDEGLVYYHLGRYDDAFNAFTEIIDPETTAAKLPGTFERTRLEALNSFTMTTLRNPKRDMELSIRLSKDRNVL
jgi:tetratricopeptide (TPR) repeat protein